MTPQGSFFKRNLVSCWSVCWPRCPLSWRCSTASRSPSLLANEAGESKFIQGLLIEVFILAVFAISYDLVLGITGLLSFGHGMFFAFGAVPERHPAQELWLAAVAGVDRHRRAGRVAGAAVCHRPAARQGHHLCAGDAGHRRGLRYHGQVAGAEQRTPAPTLGCKACRGRPASARWTTVCASTTSRSSSPWWSTLIYKRFVDSPTGRVCIATRENENRALSIGFNTFYFKLAALIVASITAALAGTLHTLYKPIVSPEIASLGFTVQGLLMLLIGGIGTLSGAMVGAAILRLMEFYFSRWFGESAGFIIGMVYVADRLVPPLRHRGHVAAPALAGQRGLGAAGVVHQQRH